MPGIRMDEEREKKFFVHSLLIATDMSFNMYYVIVLLIYSYKQMTKCNEK